MEVLSGRGGIALPGSGTRRWSSDRWFGGGVRFVTDRVACPGWEIRVQMMR